MSLPRSSDIGPPNITPPLRGLNQRVLRRVPTRGELAGPDVSVFKAGAFNKADLLLVEGAGAPLLVKDFSKKNWWYRFIGRVQLWRESLAYRRVGPVEGLPRFAGRIDSLALALEKIDGSSLGDSPERTVVGPRLFPRLVAVVERLHSRGLLHLDLRSRDNVIYTADGRVYVVDLASAVRMREGTVAHRLLFHRLKRIDDSALLKWKRALGAGPLSPEEQRFLDRFHFWRRFWIFDPKHPRRRRQAQDPSDSVSASGGEGAK